MVSFIVAQFSAFRPAEFIYVNLYVWAERDCTNTETIMRLTATLGPNVMLLIKSLLPFGLHNSILTSSTYNTTILRIGEHSTSTERLNNICSTDRHTEQSGQPGWQQSAQDLIPDNGCTKSDIPRELRPSHFRYYCSTSAASPPAKVCGRSRGCFSM